jgi:pimeloyl-ACP methyl ester carboxylesterase
MASPVRAEQRASFYDSRAALGRSCAPASGGLLAHTSSANTARDLELLRQAVGDERLNFLGYSYGTYLGATYANLFPTALVPWSSTVPWTWWRTRRADRVKRTCRSMCVPILLARRPRNSTRLRPLRPSRAPLRLLCW